MARTVVKSYSLRPQTAERVKKLAKLHGESESRIADELLRDALDQAEYVAEATTNPVVMKAVAQALSEPGVLRSMLDAMRVTLTDEQLNLFAPPPPVKVGRGVLEREGVLKPKPQAGATPRPSRRKSR